MISSHGSGPFILAIDIGGTKTLVCLVDSKGEVRYQHRIPTGAKREPDAVIQTIVSLMQEVLKDHALVASQLQGIGISMAGLCDPGAGVVLHSPNLVGWRDIPLTRRVEAALEVPVVMGNDANLAAMGEHTYGAGRGVRHMIYITVSTGIGGGIIIDGRLYQGVTGSAGEIGHTVVDVDGPVCSCGQRGCLESLAGGWALAQRAREFLAGGVPSPLLKLAQGRPDEVSAEMVFQAAEEGDADCRAIVKEASRYLGIGLVNLVNLVNPEMIVIGGGLTQQWQTYIEPAVQVMRATCCCIRCVQDIQVVPAQLGDIAGVMGAVALVRQVYDNEKPTIR